MHLSGLFIYPIKGCGGISLERAALVERGLAFDRRYMLVDREGVFISQREIAKLCLVRSEMSDASLSVTAPSMPPLVVPLEVTQGEAQPYRLWDSSGSALRVAEGSRWFSELLGDEVSLLFMPDDERRAVNPKRARPGDIVSFADGYPLLVISEASLADLNRRLDAALPMSRFRPNLVVSGCEPFAEDGFQRVTIGGISMRGVKRCERCVVTTIDQETAQSGKEPLRTLSQYRKQDNKVWFGMNLIHDGSGELSVGDSVLVDS